MKEATVLLASASAITSTAHAQSLSDAVNAALANNCTALAGATPRFVDRWQADAVLDVVDVTNGETGVTTPDVPAPVTVTDGSGRTYIVRRSTPSNLDPAVAPTLTEAQIYAIFETSGVQFLELSRFPTSAFGPGLSGLCQSVLARTNSNGNSTSANGVSGGSSSTSGRSVSSLSSARDQSEESKKRKKKRRKEGTERQADRAYIRLASADGGVGLLADAAGTGPFGVETFIDVRGGYTDLDRDTTALEGGFDGGATFIAGSISADFTERFGVAGSVGWQRVRGDFEAVNPSGGANDFSERTLTGAAYLLASLPVGSANGRDLSLDLSAGGFYGRGKGEINRSFSSLRQATFQLDVHAPGNPGQFGQTILVTTTTPVSDDLAGNYKSRTHGYSAAASMTFDFGAFSVTPGVEYTRFSTRQDGFQESVTDGFNNGLALRFAQYEDKWSQTRLGGAVGRAFGAVRVEAYGDLVLIGNAATPRRTAYFADDLRAAPYAINYDVDDLDKTFGRFGLVAAAAVANGMEVYLGAETLAGHDYLSARTFFAGVRFTP